MPETIMSEYTTYPSMVTRWNKVNRKMGFKAHSVPEWEEWSRELRAKLGSLTGFDIMDPAPLEPANPRGERISRLFSPENRYSD